jgi:four helix bundle protein
MNRDDLRERTKAFALRVMNMVDNLPRNRKAGVLSGQILRSATSVAANYRSACRSRSLAEFASKVSIALEEADETGLWLELIVEGGLLPATRLADLQNECNELTAILFTSQRTARKKSKRTES